jgi:Tol biopolymer transport system component
MAMLMCCRHVSKRLLVVMCLSIILLVSCGTSASADLMLFAQGGSIEYIGHAWSPDGQWLAVGSTSLTTITIFSANGQIVNQLKPECFLGGSDEDFSWLPDGQISCFKDSESPLLDVITLNSKGQGSNKSSIRVPINPGTNVFAMQWNPKRDWLATIAESQPGSSTATLYVSDSAGRELLPPMMVNASHLAWSPDGTRLALTENGSGTVILLTMEQATTEKLMIVKEQRLAVGTSAMDTLAWSPSGRWLVCRHASYKSEDYLFLVATDGSGREVKITSSTTDGQLYDPAWSPDGKQLIVSRVSDGSLVSLNIAAILQAKRVKP